MVAVALCRRNLRPDAIFLTWPSTGTILSDTRLTTGTKRNLPGSVSGDSEVWTIYLAWRGVECGGEDGDG